MLYGADQAISGTVLVVDDETHNRQSMERFLTLEGYKVKTVSDGNAALEELKQGQIDLVLLDVLMSPVDGLEVCRRIKSNPGTSLVPVILLTSLPGRQDRIDGINAGADDFLSRPVDQSELLARVKSLLRLKVQTDELERTEAVLFTLARSIEGKDPYTLGHCERLSAYSTRLGQSIGLPPEQITALHRAGIVHDIGKIAIPDQVLLKAGPLSDEEWALMRQHPVAGERICAPLKSFRAVLPIIRHHHEKFDGSGYPDKLAGEAIPLTARILQTVDVYDSLTTVRPYKPAISNLEAMAIMKDEVARGWWDPAIFREFEKLVASAGWKTIPPRAMAAKAGR